MVLQKVSDIYLKSILAVVLILIEKVFTLYNLARQSSSRTAFSIRLMLDKAYAYRPFVNSHLGLSGIYLLRKSNGITTNSPMANIIFHAKILLK
jgi:ABC-type xylose transport system permease subunit